MLARIKQPINDMDGAIDADNVAEVNQMVVDNNMGLDHRALVAR